MCGQAAPEREGSRPRADRARRDLRREESLRGGLYEPQREERTGRAQSRQRACQRVVERLPLEPEQSALVEGEGDLQGQREPHHADAGHHSLRREGLRPNPVQGQRRREREDSRPGEYGQKPVESLKGEYEVALCSRARAIGREAREFAVERHAYPEVEDYEDTLQCDEEADQPERLRAHQFNVERDAEEADGGRPRRA